METARVESLWIHEHDNRDEMGKAAANRVRESIEEALGNQETVSIVFASAPSQLEFLRSLREMDSIDWHRIRCFHLDEYVGMASEAPQSFSRFLRDE